MWYRYAGQVWHGQGHRRGSHRVHIREQTQVARDKPEDGAEDSGSLEDGAGEIQGAGREHLHEARGGQVDVDVLTISKRHEGRRHAMDICSYNSHGDGVDTGNGGIAWASNS